MRNENPSFKLLTVEAFLALENVSSMRHEYVAGRMYVMQGSTARHNKIASNIHGHLGTAVRGGPCEAYIIDLKVRAAKDRVYYPDGVVVCTPHAGETLIFNDPCLIVEVTSRSTRRLDHGEKLDAYLAIPSLKGYLIAEHDRRHVTLYSRAAHGEWKRDEVMTSGRVALPCPMTELSLEKIYEGVELPQLRVSEHPEIDDTWLEEDEEAEAEAFEPKG